MKIKFLGKSGDENTNSKGKKKSPHYDNLEYLDNNQPIKSDMENALVSYFDDFFNIKPYLNSGKVSVEVCDNINLPDDKFHHGLVGSLIYDTFTKIDATQYGLATTTEVIASKGEDQHYVDYFLPH